ncbi:YciI family protein [Agaribacterium sp. ZY112]|uniref:YciI family protein n=1 Tax=Agaribacterium sp. ZY112 TaxID=3233574 RepID=UPI003525F8E1
MFIIDITYKVSLDLVEPHLQAHISWLERHYASGLFVASGRKEPRTGGIILALSDSLESLQDIAKQDPFFEQGLSDIRITEFIPSKAGDAFNSLLDAP